MEPRRRPETTTRRKVGRATTPSAARPRLVIVPPPRSVAVPPGPHGVSPDAGLERAAHRFLDHRPNRCPKCGSTFLGHEPAFIHCRYCGAMARIANTSLVDQEEFEIRSGLRLAS